MTESIHSFEVQQRVLEAMLPHVPFDGWTFAALAKAAKDAEIADSDVPFLFDGDLDQVMTCYGVYVRTGLMGALAQQNLAGLGMTGKIKLALNTHFSRLSQGLERQTAKYLAHPLRLPLAQKMTFELMDDIWHWAGDESTDFNYYSKRLLLEAVYASTFSYWIWQSPDADKLDAFINARLNNVMVIPKVKSKIMGFFKGLSA